MRETRNAQVSIFESYSKHEFGAQLQTLSRPGCCDTTYPSYYSRWLMTYIMQLNY